MATHDNKQPEAKPSMTTQLSATAQKAGTEYAKSAAKEAGKQTVDYEQDNGQEQLDQAKQKLEEAEAEAKGMFAKFCPCFSG